MTEQRTLSDSMEELLAAERELREKAEVRVKELSRNAIPRGGHVLELMRSEGCIHLRPEEYHALLNRAERAERERVEAGIAWQASESYRVRLCEMLGIDYTCEEPETVEQAVARILKERDEARKQLSELQRQLAEKGFLEGNGRGFGQRCFKVE